VKYLDHDSLTCNGSHIVCANTELRLKAPGRVVSILCHISMGTGSCMVWNGVWRDYTYYS